MRLPETFHPGRHITKLVGLQRFWRGYNCMKLIKLLPDKLVTRLFKV